MLMVLLSPHNYNLHEVFLFCLEALYVTEYSGSSTRLNPGLAVTSSLLTLVVIASGSCLMVQLCYKLITKKRQYVRYNLCHMCLS